jgi:hypothetical protein
VKGIKWWGRTIRRAKATIDESFSTAKAARLCRQFPHGRHLAATARANATEKIQARRSVSNEARA